MTFHFVVLKPFDDYQRGELITDIEAVKRILAGPHASFVVRVKAKAG